jgi:molecular chaperone GrpE
MDQQSDNHQQDQSLEQLKQDLEQATNNWKRTLADFENFKKQKDKENRELIEFAREVVVARLLPALDSLGQALKHMPEYRNQESGIMNQGYEKQYSNWQVGVKGIVSQLDKTLGELGVKKIEAMGKKFDPHFHEAVREVDSEAESGMIVEELQTGFELNGKVIRPSQVVISKQSLNDTLDA